MKKSFAFFGRKREIDELLTLHALGRDVLIVGPGGIGKSALLRHFRQYRPLLLCEETSSLRRICSSLERQLNCAHRKINLIERKNRLLAYLLCRGEPIAFDHVSRTLPRIARFIARLGEQVPIWLACHSDKPHDIGQIWPELYKFTRVEISPLTELETRALVAEAVTQGHIQGNAREHVDRLHRMSGGNPRILEELLIELCARKYKIDSSFGLDLLELDRRIHDIERSVRGTAETKNE
jgi:hypothetical protein